jgi:4-amino-4-deoxy-L-arabinose transferase-like glycosyltransferase
MENDSAQFAVMAMRMIQEQNWLELWKGTEEYLDKPHLHYWLAAISYSIFGVHDWAYRLPALMAILLGTYSCFGLGKVLYGSNAGRLGALIFLSAQTIVLSGIDVRTDAVLTGFVALSLWKLSAYIVSGRLSQLLVGALAAGLAFSTKGQIALVVIGLPVLFHLINHPRQQWFSVSRLLLALLIFLLAISPMLFAYYQQFDLHPEKIIRGRDHRSGILFIFWEQSFERLSGEGMGKNSSDYFFFFHTFLWVFLPWTFFGLWAYGERLGTAWKSFRAKSLGTGEWMTAGGITTIFLLISFAQFKLPHYLNIIIPLFSVLTAGYLDRQHREGKSGWFRNFARLQWFVFSVFMVVTVLILFWVFPVPLSIGISVVIIPLVSAYLIWKLTGNGIPRIIGITLLSSVFLNLILNGHFYPRLLEYQSGSELAKLIKEESLDVETIFKLDQEHTWALDFYFGKPAVYREIESLPSNESAWFFIDEKQREMLHSEGKKWDAEREVNQFRISRLQGRFLNPATREKVIRKRYLVRIIPSQMAPEY